jgi:uncharacterized protein YukE
VIHRQIDGRPVAGYATTDGGFISVDGTIYVTSSGTVEHGISTPDGQFLENGTSRTLPDGTVVYGYTDGPDFYSYDGTVLVLADGTVVHGTLDQATGIFTADGGNVYVLTDTGIDPGTLGSDGSVTLGNGDVVMTAHSWAVDLAQLENAIAVVSGVALSIERHHSTIVSLCGEVDDDVWQSPGGQTFSDVSARLNDAMTTLDQLMDDIVDRMRTSYDNYEQAEKAATQNFTA